MGFNINDIDGGSFFFYLDEGKDFQITKEEAIIKIVEAKCVVKVEGMEHLCPESKSVHMFISPINSRSFDTHCDDVDLKILCIKGEKMFNVANKDRLLKEGDFVVVPAGTPHRATNDKASVILSIEL